MGFYTQLLFNEMEVPKKCLWPLRDSAREILSQEDCPWSYMLRFIYLERSDGKTIDLQLSRNMEKELTKLNGKPPTPLDTIPMPEQGKDDDEEPDDPWYVLAWHPFNGGAWGKWYYTDGFAAWICSFCTDGQLFQLTYEEGGGLWGWQFFEGRFRELELRPKGRWRKGTPSCIN